MESNRNSIFARQKFAGKWALLVISHLEIFLHDINDVQLSITKYWIWLRACPVNVQIFSFKMMQQEKV
jgi:hypothetical protein